MGELREERKLQLVVNNVYNYTIHYHFYTHHYFPFHLKAHNWVNYRSSHKSDLETIFTNKFVLIFYFV